MIKISTRFSEAFLARYYDFIAEDIILTKLPMLVATYPQSEGFVNYICQNFRKLITSEFDILIDLQHEINRIFPLISESYNPSVYYSECNLQPYICIEQISNIHLNSRNASRQILDLKPEASSELESFSETYNSHYTRLLRDDMLATQNAREIKKICIDFKRNIQDKKTAYDNMPEWIGKLSDIFSYDNIPPYILTELATDIALDYCPMCNESKVGNIIDEDRTYRPALDHFLPKSKYPHFSLSIYNLIPTCHTCNSTFKRDKETFIPMHANPYIIGADNHDLFDFNDLIEYVLYNYSSGLRVKLKTTIPEIDNNMKLFKIRGVYNKKSTKSDILLLAQQFKNYNSHWKNSMTYEVFLELIIGYNPEKSLFEICHGKLKKDIIKFFEDFRW
ncbi:hypothetical protein [Klebsiella pneumoniae]|uniref:hypothetical protein n=1 Tax=Klebsiella pneumoniae complex TaxID=3390273 RepID=UPI00065102BA|nr:hypothetical protein [Klebsiella pneumoniae]KMH38989.1 hypothetical protein SM72_01204 [Klebsiella pneumoniae]MBC4874946.1 hypothetical protein [Klebsiella pneumoniae]MBV0568043.1 hypothetical protein [Klebsiella pneumoniae]MCA5289627.1 hypothetical protein [Klebsiella pneumoniae]MCA5299132.1 hypothetical protein [Klebsiella pneumoniae]